MAFGNPLQPFVHNFVVDDENTEEVIDFAAEGVTAVSTFIRNYGGGIVYIYLNDLTEINQVILLDNDDQLQLDFTIHKLTVQSHPVSGVYPSATVFVMAGVAKN